jgi:hypothetical protein
MDVWLHTTFHFSGPLVTTVKSKFCTAAFYRIKNVNKMAYSSYITLHHSTTFSLWRSGVLRLRYRWDSVPAFKNLLSTHGSLVWFLYHISVKSLVRKQTDMLHTHTYISTQYGDLGYPRVHSYILKGQEVAF